MNLAFVLLSPLYNKLNQEKIMKPVMLMNDLHISKDNIEEFNKNWKEALVVASEYKVQYIFIGGDMFTTRAVQSLAPMLAVKDCLEKASEKGFAVHVVNGNHDLVSYDGGHGWCNLYSDIKNVYVHTQPYLYELEGVWLAMFPYYLEDTIMLKVLDEFDKKLHENEISPKDVVLYLHSGIHGALGDFDVPNELSQERLVKYYKVLAGHYHNRTHIKGTNIYYIGSSRANSFGEDDEKGYTILFPDGETEFVQNEVNIRYATEDVVLSELKDWKRNYDSRYKVRLRIHCQSSEVDTVDRDELHSRGVNKIEFTTEKIQTIKAEQSKMEEKFDTKDLQHEYESFCGEKDINSTLGIKYLNQI